MPALTFYPLPPGEERADDGFEFSNVDSANSDAGLLERWRIILPLLGERAGVREDKCHPNELKFHPRNPGFYAFFVLFAANRFPHS